MARLEPFGTEATSQTPDLVANLDPGADEPLGSLEDPGAQMPPPDALAGPQQGPEHGLGAPQPELGLTDHPSRRKCFLSS